MGGIFIKEKYKKEILEYIKSIIVAGILAFFIITFIMQSFVVEGSSMEPNFHDGERLFVNKFIYRFKDPERFDVVIFSPPIARKSRYIKRVIGLPGETISIKKGNIYIDGQKLEEKRIIKEPMQLSKVYFPKTKIPEDYVFVMGNNRNHSMDSTEFGPVPIDTIMGEVFVVYWPLTKIRISFLKELE